MPPYVDEPRQEMDADGLILLMVMRVVEEEEEEEKEEEETVDGWIRQRTEGDDVGS